MNYANIYLHNSISDDKMTNVMTVQTSRQRILAYLRLHNGVSTAEISRALRVTSANIRHHLAILVSDGRVQVLGARQGDGRGRRAQIFGLSDAAVGNNLAWLADSVLRKWLDVLPPESTEAALVTLANQVYADCESCRAMPNSPAAFSRRITHLMEHLNRIGYLARWEVHSAGPIIIFEHCPYAEIVAAHPELCRMDGLLLARKLGVGVEQTARLEKTSRGTSYCQFLIKPGR